MAVITRYELRVEGILRGSPAANAADIELFKDTLTRLAPDPGQGGPGSPDPWPEGFVIRGYKAYIWEPEGYPHAHMPDHTVLSFHAEVAVFFQGSSHVPGTQDRARREYDWFLTHDQLAWCQDLMARLAALNGKFAAKLVESIHMRRFHWYIGNGGS